MTAHTTSRPRPSWRKLETFHKVKLAFMAAGFASLALSVGLWATDFREEAIFVGLWVPAIHSLGALVLSGERGSR